MRDTKFGHYRWRLDTSHELLHLHVESQMPKLFVPTQGQICQRNNRQNYRAGTLSTFKKEVEGFRLRIRCARLTQEICSFSDHRRVQPPGSIKDRRSGEAGDSRS